MDAPAPAKRHVLSHCCRAVTGTASGGLPWHENQLTPLKSPSKVR